MTEPQSLHSLYRQMEKEREPYLRRAQDASKLTMPALFPPDGTSGSSDLDNPYQSTGAKGIRALSSHLMLSLLPHDFAPVRLEPQAGGRALRGLRAKKRLEQLDAESAYLEQRMLQAIHRYHLRPALQKACQYSLVGGLGLLDFRRDTPRATRFENVGLRKDPRGEVLTLLVREAVPQELLPEGYTSDQVARQMAQRGMQGIMPHLYTLVQRKPGGGYESFQRVHAPNTDAEEVLVEGSEETYPTWHDSPWVLLPFDEQDGEHYPRSFIDNVVGDLMALEGLSKCGLEGAIMAAIQRFLCDPAGLTRPEDLIAANNGGFVWGREQDVKALSSRQNTVDLSWTQTEKDQLRRSLGEDFLLFLATRREAERVTADENRLVVTELRRTFGGNYANYSVALEHIGNVLLRRMRLDDPMAAPSFEAFDALDVDTEMRVIAGIEMIGRAEALERKTLALNIFTQIMGPEELQKRIEPTDLLRELHTDVGAPKPAYMLTEEQVQEREAATREANLEEQLADPVAKAALEQASAQQTRQLER